MVKPYLVFMAGPNSLTDLQELISPIKPFIRGICALLHDSDEFSPEAAYLLGVNNELGGGNIIFGSYVGRHDHSRNRILFETGINEGDYLISLDSLERVSLTFAESLPTLIDAMTKGNIDILSYYFKPYLIRFRGDMYYKGTPHEALLGDYELRRVEYNQYEPDESKVRINMRPIKRADDPFHWCGHYMKYLLLPNSNQNLLGLEHHGGGEAFPKLEEIRHKLVKLLKKHGLSRDIKGVTMLFSVLDDETRELINNHKILNDFYRLNILNDKTVKDDHSQESWNNLPQF